MEENTTTTEENITEPAEPEPSNLPSCRLCDDDIERLADALVRKLKAENDKVESGENEG